MTKIFLQNQPFEMMMLLPMSTSLDSRTFPLPLTSTMPRKQEKDDSRQRYTRTQWKRGIHLSLLKSCEKRKKHLKISRYDQSFRESDSVKTIFKRQCVCIYFSYRSELSTCSPKNVLNVLKNSRWLAVEINEFFEQQVFQVVIFINLWY